MNRPSPAEVDERIADWVDERMTPRERDRFEAEMRVNARLRAQAEGYQRLVRGLRSLRDTDSNAKGNAEGNTESNAVDVRDRVVAALQKPQAPRSPIRSGRPSRPALVASSVVAAAALVLVSVLSQWQPAIGARSDLAAAATPPAAASKAGPDASAGMPESLSKGGGGALQGGAPLAGLRDEQFADAPGRATDSRRWPANGVPTSVVPQITIAASRLPVVDPPIAGGGGGGGGRTADGEKSGSSALDRAALDWKALAVGLRVESLTGVPLPAAKGDASDDSSTGATAFLVEGAKADLTAFLRRLSETAQTRGWEVRNGEADAQSVIAMVPAAPATPSYVEGEPERVREKAKDKQAAPSAGPFVRLVVVVHSQPR